MSCEASPAWGHHIVSHYHTVRGVAVPCLVTPPRCKLLVVWHHPIGPPHHYSGTYEWSTGPALHCVYMFACLASLSGAARPNVLRQEPSRMPRPAKTFFIPEACGVRSRGARGSAGALSSREAGYRAAGHVAAPEPSRAKRRGPKLCDT
jgi:hypothetical protein